MIRQHKFKQYRKGELEFEYSLISVTWRLEELRRVKLPLSQYHHHCQTTLHPGEIPLLTGLRHALEFLQEDIIPCRCLIKHKILFPNLLILK